MTTQRKIKLLHIINDLSCNGGAQRVVMDLVSYYPPDFEIRIVTLDPINDYLPQLEQLRIQCDCWQQLSLGQKWQLLRWPDLIHSHLHPSIYLAIAALGKKRIQTEHATHNRRRDHKVLQPLEWWLYGNYDRVACISQDVKQALVDFLPTWQQRYQVINNGIDLTRYSQHSRSLNDQPSIRIGMVGRFHQYKDHPLLFNALALLPKNYQLHLAGDGERYDEYLALATALKIKDRVFFHGIREDIPVFLDSLDIYVQSAHVEGFGLAALEAMASGLPTLGSNIPGLKHVIADERYLFYPDDARPLANQIEALCRDPALYHQASLASLTRSQAFSLTQCIDGYYQLYQEVVNES